MNPTARKIRLYHQPSEIDGRRIETEVAANLAGKVLVGGPHTLPSVIGWTLRHLAEHPDLRRRIMEEPSVASTAVEEFFRIYSVASRESRRVARDLDFMACRCSLTIE